MLQIMTIGFAGLWNISEGVELTESFVGSKLFNSFLSLQNSLPSLKYLFAKLRLVLTSQTKCSIESP